MGDEGRRCQPGGTPAKDDRSRAVPQFCYGVTIVNSTIVRRRVYRSPRREQQASDTRRRILGAATQLFLTRGIAVTTMRAVAASAGTALPTVELAFATKARLLQAAIDVAIAGDDQPVPMLRREWVARAGEAASAEDFLTIVGAVLTSSQRRSAGLVVAAFEGARTNPELRALAEELTRQRATTVAWIVDQIAERTPLRRELTRE